MIQLKVKHPNGSSNTILVQSSDSAISFTLKIKEVFSLTPTTTFFLRFGQPPNKDLPINSSESLASFGLIDSQVVLIQQLISSNSPNKQQPTTKKTKRTKPIVEEEEEEYSSESDEEDDARKPTTRRRVSTFVTSNIIHRGGNKKTTNKKPRTMEGLGEDLALAHTKAASAGGDPIFKYFRNLTKSEMQKAMEVTKSQAQWMSVLTLDYTIEVGKGEQEVRRLQDGAVMEMPLVIKYRKGKRSFATEHLLGLSKEVLKSTVEFILHHPLTQDPQDLFHHPRERLRPHLLPLISPRMFWSFVYWFGGG
jgi:hypothetical protein